MIGDLFFGIFGLASLIGIAFLFSSNRTKIDWRLVGTGILLQLIFAIFVLKVPGGEAVFNALSRFFVTIISFTFDGAEFVFGILSSQSDMEKILPADMKNMGFGFCWSHTCAQT